MSNKRVILTEWLEGMDVELEAKKDIDGSDDSLYIKIPEAWYGTTDINKMIKFLQRIKKEQ